jgi:hypothetical protein
MKVLLKRERLPIVKPFGEVTVELLDAPKATQRQITLKDGTVKTIEDYSVLIRPLLGKFESVIEKEVMKTEDGDKVVRPKKYDAVQLSDRAVLKLSSRAYEVLYNAWQSKEIDLGTRLKIRTTKKGNKTYFDEIIVLDDEDDVVKSDAGETTETVAETRPTQAKPQNQVRPKLKG